MKMYTTEDNIEIIEEYSKIVNHKPEFAHELQLERVNESELFIVSAMNKNHSDFRPLDFFDELDGKVSVLIPMNQERE